MSEIAELIARYKQAATELASDLHGLTTAQLTATPVPGTWSIAEIAWHMIDSDLILADRMKRVIAEEQPSLIGFNESLFAERLFYQQQNLELGVELFRINRLLQADLLAKLSVEDFQRTGLHNEAGVKSLLDLLRTAVKHWEHHRQYLVDKRRMVTSN
jgi:uncharacterized damage-inducible protein DinB